MKMAESMLRKDSDRYRGEYWAMWAANQREPQKPLEPPKGIRATMGRLYCEETGRWCSWVNIEDGSCTKGEYCNMRK